MHEYKEYYTSIAKKTGKQVYIPGILLEAAKHPKGRIHRSNYKKTPKKSVN